MHVSIIWSSIRNGNIVASFLENSLAFFQHFCNVHVRIATAKYSIDRRFINNQIKLIILIFKVHHIHDLPFHFRSFCLISCFHLIYTHLRNVHVEYVKISLIIHFFRYQGITTPQIHNLKVLFHFCLYILFSSFKIGFCLIFAHEHIISFRNWNLIFL